MTRKNNPRKSTPLVETNPQLSIDTNIKEISIEVEGNLDFPLSILASPQTIKNVAEWERKKKADTQSQLVLMLSAFWGVSLLTCLLFVGIGTLKPSADKELIKDMSVKILGAETVLYGAVLKYYFDKKPKDK
jgi:hypothetical protein